MTNPKLNGFTIAHLAWILLPLDRPKKKKKKKRKKYHFLCILNNLPFVVWGIMSEQAWGFVSQLQCTIQRLGYALLMYFSFPLIKVPFSCDVKFRGEQWSDRMWSLEQNTLMFPLSK